jgi:hypothetical protein
MYAVYLLGKLDNTGWLNHVCRELNLVFFTSPYAPFSTLFSTAAAFFIVGLFGTLASGQYRLYLDALPEAYAGKAVPRCYRGANGGG